MRSDVENSGPNSSPTPDPSRRVAHGPAGIRGPPPSVGAVVYADPLQPKALASQLRDLLREKHIPVLRPSSKKLHRLLQPLGIEIYQARHPRTTNDQSLVVSVADHQTADTFLITGDLTRRSWQEICTQLPSKPLVIQAPHHGGEPVLLDMVAELEPSKILISADRANRYGHPKVELLQALSRRGHYNLRRGAQVYQRYANNVMRVPGELRDAAFELQTLFVYEAGFSERQLRQELSLALPETEMWLGLPLRKAPRLQVLLQDLRRYRKPKPLSYEDVIITGYAGHSSIAASGAVRTARPSLSPEERFHREMIWMSCDMPPTMSFQPLPTGMRCRHSLLGR